MSRLVLLGVGMAAVSKGKSPFYPGQPVPVELFVGRHPQIDRIIQRGIGQASQGKPVSIFVQGEYGIGKSSIARFVQWLAEKDFGLHGIYAPLGGAGTLADMAVAVTEATLRSGAYDATRSERMRDFLAKYIGQQEMFGFFTLNLDALKRDVPDLSTPFGMLRFLSQTYERLKDTGVRGIFLVLDEINGITSDPEFAHFIKGIVEANSLSREPLPLLLLLCGVEERRREMIRAHQPVDRIFDVVEISTMTNDEMTQFFDRAFESVQMKVPADAMSVLTHYSAGFPKVMHLVGDEAYWLDRDGTVDRDDALAAVVAAADDVGKKYVDQQVYRALRSPDYRSILAKIGKMDPNTMSFAKTGVEKGLTDTEKRKFNNFLQKMKQLQVLRSGETRGEYVFNMRMVRLYIWLQSLAKQEASSSAQSRS